MAPVPSHPPCSVRGFTIMRTRTSSKIMPPKCYFTGTIQLTPYFLPTPYYANAPCPFAGQVSSTLSFPFGTPTLDHTPYHRHLPSPSPSRTPSPRNCPLNSVIADLASWKLFPSSVPEDFFLKISEFSRWNTFTDFWSPSSIGQQPVIKLSHSPTLTRVKYLLL